MNEASVSNKRPMHYTVAVIGSGFGGTMTALPLARRFKQRNRGETILILERGTWWTTPVGTVQDKEVKTYQFLRDKAQPVQFWPSVDHFKGFMDIFVRCFRRKRNEDGLYDLTKLGKRGFLGFLGGESDGVTIARASGVGGGSLVYSNVTIGPPDLVLDDPRWPTTWTHDERNAYYDLARDAIGQGVLFALDKRDGITNPSPPVNTGLSNIVTRSARLDPHWRVKPDSNNSRGIKQTNPGNIADPQNELWIDRARVFQTEVSKLTNDYGTVDSSINDINPEPNPFNPAGSPKNYCERQGRCNVGCLPGARHTLNKQLMPAVLGKFDGTPPLFPNMHLAPLAEVNIIRALPQGGYEIHYLQRDQQKPWRAQSQKVTAGVVIVAAGCVGTNELMLRCKDQRTLPNLSDRVGFGFSTNGDYIAFLEGTNQRVSLTRGPVTTSFAHFHTPEAPLNANQPTDPSKFHTLEDNGIPKALSSAVGFGVPLLRSLAKGRNPRLFIIWALFLWSIKRLVHYVRAFFLDYTDRQDVFQSEDEYTANMMCVTAFGREASVGQFRLGKSARETPLRVKRTDKKEFYQDPIYGEIRTSLDRLADQLTSDKNRKFINPFLTPTAEALATDSIVVTHPLGGCRMGKNATEGVVDEYGRVFDKTLTGDRRFYDGLYIADAAIIPTALGVNPSLTISALALRIVEKMIQERYTP